MAISGKMVALKDKSNNVVFPETSSQAVYMDNGKTLEALTDEGVFFGENSDVVQLSKPEIIEKINTMESKITEVDSRLEQFNNHSINSFNIYNIENSNSDEIANVISKMNSGDTLILTGVFNISSTISINKNINIIGNNVSLLTQLNGLDNIFKIENSSGIIQGIKFNQNLKGRTSIELNGCENFKISNCCFTGYSKEYGYYRTDGGIRINNSKNITIDNNEWINHGQQYDQATENLNRCISVQTNSDAIKITNNNFTNVNQAIVVQDGTSNIISNNIFTNVNDNCIYLTSGVKGIVIDSNTFNNTNDEGIVFNGENIIISNNLFTDVPNKVIALNGNAKNVNISNNVINELNKSEMFFIRVRDEISSNVQLENISICNNIIYGNFGYSVILLNNCKKLNINDNIFNINFTQANYHIIKIDGTNSFVTIKNNKLEQNGGSNIYAIRLSGTYISSVIDSNICVNSTCRIGYPPEGVAIRNQYRIPSGYLYGTDCMFLYGSGSPEGVISAQKGSIYIQTDGSNSLGMYVKQSSDNSNTGWVAK